MAVLPRINTEASLILPISNRFHSVLYVHVYHRIYGTLFYGIIETRTCQQEDLPEEYHQENSKH